MKTKKVVATIFVIFCFIAAVVVGILSIIKNENFWTVNAAQVLTLIVSIGIAFWVTQLKTDERNKKSHAEQILRKIQQFVSSDIFCKVPPTISNEEYKKQIGIINRSTNNAISILTDYANELGFEEEAEYIEDQFKDYRDFVSMHLEDIDYLSKSESTLRKYSENIDNKCDLIIFSL